MAESQDDALQIKVDQLLDFTLNLCASIVRAGIKGTQEFSLILNDLGVDEATQQSLLQIFQAHFVEKLEQINSVYEA